MAERAANITYWQGIRTAQIADGQAGDYSPDTINAGDLVKIRHHGWTPVLRTNTKTVSVQTPAPFGGRLIRHTVPYPETQGHRPQSETNDTTERHHRGHGHGLTTAAGPTPHSRTHPAQPDPPRTTGPTPHRRGGSGASGVEPEAPQGAPRPPHASGRHSRHARVTSAHADHKR